MNAQIQVTCDRELTDAPEWVHLVPAGTSKARDGRRFVVSDPQALVRTFAAQELDLAIDYEHQLDRPEARNSGPVPVAGWIKELAARADGIWGRVEWTKRAKELIGNREYRFLSPSMLCDKNTGRVLKINGAGLVHRPALHLTALASQEDTMADDTTLLERLAALLGMSIEDGEDAILDAFEKRLEDGGKPDPAKYVPIEAVEDMMKDRASEKGALKSERVATKVEKAFQEGYLTPAMRAWATELCSADEDSFDAFLSRAIPAYADLTTELCVGRPPGYKPQGSIASDEVNSICSQLGLTPDQLHS